MYDQKKYFRAWMNWQIDAQNKSIFDSKNAKKKRLEKYFEELGINKYAASNEDEKAEIKSEWEKFAKDYMEVTLSDRTFGSQFFGMVSLKDEQLEFKMADILIKTCLIYPEGLEKREKSEPFFEVFRAAFLGVRPEAKKFF